MGDSSECPKCNRSDKRMSMVECTRCKNWFHFRCVGVDKSVTNRNWFCSTICEDAENNQTTTDKTNFGDPKPVEKTSNNTSGQRQKASSGSLSGASNTTGTTVKPSSRVSSRTSSRASTSNSTRRAALKLKQIDEEFELMSKLQKERESLMKSYLKQKHQQQLLIDCEEDFENDELSDSELEEQRNAKTSDWVESASQQNVREKDTDDKNIDRRGSAGNNCTQPTNPIGKSALIDANPVANVKSSQEVNKLQLNVNTGNQFGDWQLSSPTKEQLIARKSINTELPIFTGKPEEWNSFFSFFEMTTFMCGFNNVDNLMRLRKCLKEDAYGAVRNRLNYPQKVPEIIEELRKSFGQPSVIVDIEIDKVRKIRQPKAEDLDSIVKFSNSIRDLCSMAEATGNSSYLCDASLVTELSNKLPLFLKYGWLEYKNKQPTNKVTLMVFSEWFMEKADAFKGERLMMKHDQDAKSRKPPSKEKFVNTHATSGESRDEVKTQSSEKRESVAKASGPRKCRVCYKETCQVIKDCKEFLELSVPRRWDFVKANHICHSCLRYHRGYSCKSAKECGKDGCKFKHHGLLHRETLQTKTTETPTNPTAQMYTHHHNEPSVLFRIVPCTVYGPSSTVQTYAFLDDGSSITLMQEDLAEELGLSGEADPLCLKWTSETSRYENNSQRVSFEISGTSTSQKYSVAKAHTVKNLGLPTQSFDAEKYSQMYSHLKDIPMISYKNATPKILIGLDNWFLGASSKTRENTRNQPVASKTRLGWCVYGVSSENANSDVNSIYHHSVKCCDCQIRDDDLHHLVANYFTTESLGVTSPKQQLLSIEDARATELMEKTAKRVGDRFEIGLIWKHNEIILPDSFNMARNRTVCLQNKMKNNPTLAGALNNRIEEYVSKGYARKLSDNEVKLAGPKTWYLPVFPVTNPNKMGKWRLVWDAAAKSQGVSLNSMLLKGPDMLISLPSILYRFRERSIGLTADIKEMYHQVRVNRDDQQAQRFLWPTEKGDPETYVMEVMTFGASCSPTCAQFIKNLNASEYSETYPEAAEAIAKRHYVDDYLDSMNTVDEAIKVAKEVELVHKYGGFCLRSWLSNSADVMEAMNGTTSTGEDVQLCPESGENKVLGMWWSVKTDEFLFKLTHSEKNKPILLEGKHPTKREILRVAMTVFDPLGLLANIMIYVKVLIQDIWRAQSDWDEPIPEELFLKWKNWVDILPELESVRIPRCYNLNIPITENNVELHIFSDAGEKAYATVGYLRVVDQSGMVRVALVGSKTRVAPLKILSIPRLELESCVLGSRLAKSIVDSHSIKIGSVQFWSDSRTALSWIKSDHRRYKQFVAFRVAEILETTNVSQWRYVPSKHNAADDATKWPKVINLSNIENWINGPQFLYQDKSEWPEDISIKDTTDEIRPHVLHHQVDHFTNLLKVDNFSSWNRLRNCMANVCRFVWNASSTIKKRAKRYGPISSEDLEEAENYLYRLCQREGYPDEVATLSSPDKNRHVDKSSPMYHYLPYMDEKGVLRSMGRIDAAKDIPQAMKRPIFLPVGHHVTNLVIKNCHQRYLHTNFETTINELRQRYCIPRLRVQLKKVIDHCQHCKNRRAAPIPPLMGELPAARLMSFTRPFSYVGVDYFGPMFVTIGRSKVKRWGVLTTCLTTRAIHLEISATLSTDSCILALRCVFSRRGVPLEIYSDNGTNFRGASVELLKAISQLDKHALAKEFNQPGTKWHFIPPVSPHMGGSWERLVRSVKVTLAKIMPTRNPTDELLHCMLTEVENIVNSRPLTYVPLTSENDEALTPNHFLLGSSNGLKPLGHFTDEAEVLRKNYAKAQQFSNYFWRKWIDEYLPHLTRRSKWCELSKPVEVGDIVYIVDSNSPTNCWPKGRVIKTITGSNQQVRRVTVQTPNGVYERPVVKIAVLDVKPISGKSSTDVIPGGGVANGAIIQPCNPKNDDNASTGNNDDEYIKTK